MKFTKKIKKPLLIFVGITVIFHIPFLFSIHNTEAAQQVLSDDQITSDAAGKNQSPENKSVSSNRYQALENDLIKKLIFSMPETQANADAGSIFNVPGTKSSNDTETILRDLRGIDPDAGKIWEQILMYWQQVNSEDFTNIISPEIINKDDSKLNDASESITAVLPADLPDDDSLCITVLGYGLNADGSMREELVSRLQTALLCANQYPNAYILVTGGPTAAKHPETTEADSMAAWLRDHGISRIIIENKSMTSSENAVFSYEILRNEYPQVRNMVIVTSDYHVPLGCLLFQTQFQIAGDNEISIIANAGADVPNTASFSLESQAAWLWNLVQYKYSR